MGQKEFDQRKREIEDKLFDGSATKRADADRAAADARRAAANAAYEKQMEAIRRANRS